MSRKLLSDPYLAIQATHRRRSDEPFFLLWGPSFMTGDGPKMDHEWQVMGPKEVFYSYLVPEMTW